MTIIFCNRNGSRGERTSMAPVTERISFWVSRQCGGDGRAGAADASGGGVGRSRGGSDDASLDAASSSSPTASSRSSGGGGRSTSASRSASRPQPESVRSNGLTTCGSSAKQFLKNASVVTSFQSVFIAFLRCFQYPSRAHSNQT